ncbi:hypothetical protein XACM_2924 [Xanthomonas euvesicatoria pv. citrumelo F1]|nr:hypothetical protein XACM_2924 [Xanthomonas euvesicatoria pv. citrumelo F1]PPU89281.1 hypothetical protein XaclCFBP3371_08200 [Xanthomonas euvesicatoria pv. citrumelonis]TKA20047.1 hypothetical protein TN51_01565 [Xanthomonas euvesicatoria pv. citrumelonis]
MLLAHPCCGVRWINLVLGNLKHVIKVMHHAISANTQGLTCRDGRSLTVDPLHDALPRLATGMSQSKQCLEPV